jgi:HSP20 family protein
MAIERWNPFREMLTLREAMDRLFEDSFVHPGHFVGARAADGRGRGLAFPLDVSETADAFTVRASLPGIEPEDVQITVHGETLSIRGETKQEDEQRDQNWLMREHRSGSFQRTVTLPTPIDADKAEAQFEHGMLIMTLPKAEQAKPRQIKIGAGGTAGSLGRGGTVAGTGDQARFAQPGSTDTSTTTSTTPRRSSKSADTASPRRAA